MAINLTDAVKNSNGNPTLLLRAIGARMDEASEGKLGLVDPNNSVAVMLEAIATVGAGILQAIAIETKAMYRSSVDNYSGLYRHMADSDYKGRFSKPVTDVPILIMLSLDTIIARAVAIPGSGGRRKVTIPAFTSVDVSGLTFTSEVAIDIFVLPHGAISILYNDEEVASSATINNNRLGWGIVNGEDGRYLALSIPMDQYNVNRKIISLSAMNGFKQDFAYVDSYYHMRAYMRNGNDDAWVEIGVTHQDIVFDPARPTLCARVLNGVVRVIIPQIYFNNGSVGTDIRIDLYTTKGPLNVDLVNYDPSQFKLTWKEVDDAQTSIYVAPLLDFQNIQLHSSAKVNGGTNGATFSELRSRIVGRSREAEAPINEKNLPFDALLSEYDIVLKKDIVTERKFIATRSLPAPSNKDTVTGMDLTVLPLVTRLETLVDSNFVINHADRIVIRPNMLFREVDGVLKLVADSEIDDYLDPSVYPIERLVKSVNDDKLMCTPYHYVIDNSGLESKCDAYLMTQPRISHTNFVQNNDTVGITLGSANRMVWPRADHTGYVIALALDISGIPTDLRADRIGIQLSHRISGSNTRLYYHANLTLANRDDLVLDAIDPATGRPYDDVWIYYAYINTYFDVDQNKNMTVDGHTSALGLITEMDVVFYTVNYRDPDYVPTDMDDVLNPRAIPNFNATSTYTAIAQETMVIEFGKHLEHLWSRIRTIGDTTEYQTYAADVYETYDSDVYKLNPDGSVALVYNPATTGYTRTLLHSQGDFVLSTSNQKLIKYRKGEYILGDDYKPIARNDKLSPVREIDLLLMDGSYFFADDETTMRYKEDSIGRLTGWISDEIEVMSKKFYGQSELYFYPKRNLGYVKVSVGDKTTLSIPAEQKLDVEFAISSSNYDNAELKDSIEKQTAVVLDEVFKTTTISKADCISALKAEFKESVLGVTLTGLFEDKYDLITVIDESVRPSIAKKLKITRKQTVMVANDVTVSFVIHSKQ